MRMHPCVKGMKFQQRIIVTSVQGGIEMSSDKHTKFKRWAEELTLWKCSGIPGGAHCWKGRWDHVGDRRKEDVHVLYLSNSTTVVLVSRLLVLVFSLNPLIYAQPFL